MQKSYFQKLALEFSEAFGLFELIVLIALMLAALFCTAEVKAQPTHAGVLYNAQFEGSGSGNGSITGVEGQAVYNFNIKGNELAVLNNTQVTREVKEYLGYAGQSVRSQTRLRYFFPSTRGLFVQAGVYYGRVSYTGAGGYFKNVWQPIAGSGYRFNAPSGNFSTTSLFVYQFRAPLMSRNNNGAYVDGVTKGYRITVDSTIRLKQTRWLALINFTGGHSAYQRDARTYGNELAKTWHDFNYTEISFGIGYDFSRKK